MNDVGVTMGIAASVRQALEGKRIERVEVSLNCPTYVSRGTLPEWERKSKEESEMRRSKGRHGLTRAILYLIAAAIVTAVGSNLVRESLDKQIPTPETTPEEVAKQIEDLKGR